jgi:CubicO group peptidase (beta-lactamase class C family)
MKTTAAVLTLLLVTHLALAAPPASTAWKQYASADDANFDAAALQSARDVAEAANSAAVFAVSGGRVVAAWGAVDRKLELHSVRKSLYSALWGIAEARGLVKVDATLADAGIDDLQPLTAEEKKARLSDLLQARSGVYHPAAYAPTEQEDAAPARGAHAPGTFWFYNNWDFNVAGAWLEKVTGKSMGVLFGEWIATPIGMEDYRPEDVFAVLEPGVSRYPALTFRMSARDLARFGQLWLDQGRWNGRQIVPAQWIARASASASSTGTPGQGYGMMWWTYDAGSVDAQRYPNASRVRLLLGRGTGGQTVAVIPEAGMVIVHRADTDHHRGVRGSEVWTLIDRLLGARRGTAKKNAPLVAVHVEPFANTLPALQLPTPVTLEPATLQALAGDYEIKPGVVARVFLHEGRLFGRMPGRGEAELFALSPTEFFLRVDPAVRIRVDGDSLHVNMGKSEVVGRRK